MTIDYNKRFLTKLIRIILALQYNNWLMLKIISDNVYFLLTLYQSCINRSYNYFENSVNKNK